jgi:glucose-6-phosphate isomerase
MNNSIILNYDSNLNDLSLWYQQLVGESLGKKGKGINPILSNAPKDHHSVLQLYLDGPKDKFFTFFESVNKKSNYKAANQIIPNSMKFIKNKNINFIIKAQSDAVKKIFFKDKIPFRQFLFNKKNEEELGIIFTFFVLETILLARLMKINPFDQPAVEKVKAETKRILSK